MTDSLRQPVLSYAHISFYVMSMLVLIARRILCSSHTQNVDIGTYISPGRTVLLLTFESTHHIVCSLAGRGTFRFPNNNGDAAEPLRNAIREKLRRSNSEGGLMMNKGLS